MQIISPSINAITLLIFYFVLHVPTYYSPYQLFISFGASQSPLSVSSVSDPQGAPLRNRLFDCGYLPHSASSYPFCLSSTSPWDHSCPSLSGFLSDPLVSNFLISLLTTSLTSRIPCCLIILKLMILIALASWRAAAPCLSQSTLSKFLIWTRHESPVLPPLQAI